MVTDTQTQHNTQHTDAPYHNRTVCKKQSCEAFISYTFTATNTDRLFLSRYMNVGNIMLSQYKPSLQLKPGKLVLMDILHIY